MQNQIGYHSISKAGRANEDRYRLLGGGFLPQDNRQTAFADSGRGEICAVMDGVGSAEMGMQAAQYIADKLIDFYQTDIPATISGLESLLTQINDTIFSWGVMDDQRPLGASTLTLAWLFNQQLHLFHVGDSSGFLVNSSGILKLTQAHENGHGMYRYMGQGAGFQLDIKSYALNSDDIICLVTDGVTKGVRQHEIQQTLDDYAGEPHLSAKRLVELAKQRKVQDDITAIVIEVV